ncbi:MAG: ATP-grasp domain-containing protein [Bacteriovoracaceae bacterium]|nr:ATP-grasp domain-containing protein [Bacteriovoracaceae bacterium]
MKIKKILIANRGEIAVRVIKSARAMGIKSVALYADDDAKLPHVWMADEAHGLGSGTLKETYLNQEKILGIAKSSGADAIHPGYGFLSENSGFCKMVEAAGIIFIGPTPEAIVLMGDKIGSKIAVEKYNVPMIPGYHGSNQDAAFLSAEAKRIGFPVLIKASAGGGGKGMRIVHQASEFDEALKGAKSEALKAFSNDAVLLEKYVTEPRHIEVQVMSDTHGQHFHLFERECSIQRRYQKVIEESPAPRFSKETQKAITQTAVDIAKGINYRGAGTVEFIMGADEKFYFLEMNTRLQVEHPITEMVTGLDLVGLQIKVAAGEKLDLKQSDIRQNGHAIECRICAEDPDNGFLPTIGTIHKIGSPTLKDVRLDCGFVDGSVLGVNYDSMLAKLITWAPTREEAITKMLYALDDVVFAGIKSNRDYLRRLLSHKDFKAGKTHTHFIPDHKEELLPTKAESVEFAPHIAAYLLSGVKRVSKGEGTVASTPWMTLNGLRN